MRPRIVFLALAAAIPALPQAAPPAMLDTGVPNLFPTPPPLTTGASSTNPLLIPKPSGGLTLNGSTGALSANQIWPGTAPPVPDFAATPFAIPTAAHGHVYVPTFGLCSQFDGNGNCVTGNTYTNAGVQVYAF